VLRANIAARYGVVRPFVELLAEALPLDATPAGALLLREVRRLPELLRRRVSQSRCNRPRWPHTWSR
jgi:hypothetical protein